MLTLQNAFKISSPVQNVPRRNFFAFLNFIFNRVSRSRIKEVGPDRACAEWLMRNGAHIKWKGEANYVENYNNLPLDPKIKGAFHITHVKAHEASINYQGFAHFYGCKDIANMEFQKCLYFDDRCIEQLSIVSKSLFNLKIISCYEVTNMGLGGIFKLSNLKNIVLGDLKGVKDISRFSKDLQIALPACKLEIVQPPIKPPGSSKTNKKVGLFSSQK